MNPKNARKTCAKPVPKKKMVKNGSNGKKSASVKCASDERCENNSVFYVHDDKREIVVEQPDDSHQVIGKKSPPGTLTRKLSKIYAKLSGSRESLNVQKTNNDRNVIRTDDLVQQPQGPFRFQRSLTLNSIHLGKVYKRPPLEKLSEERIAETKSPSLSPPPEMHRRNRSTDFRQSLPPGSFDDVDFTLSPPSDAIMMPPPAQLPPSPPPLQRSNSIISLFRRKVSQQSTVNESRQETTMNSRWTTSLQSLQQIDNMVSYEDLSFIDYDKFNQYETKLDEMLARRSLFLETYNKNNISTVKRRLRRNGNANCSPSSTSTDSNLDRQKNLYRQSIDSRKLNFLNDIDCDDKMVEWLSCETQKMEIDRRISDARDQRTSEGRLVESARRKRKCRSWESLSSCGTSRDNIKMVSGQ